MSQPPGRRHRSDPARRTARADGRGPTGRPDATATVAAVARRLGGLAWIGLLIATVVVLDRLGTGRLSPPPVLDRGDLRRWLDGRDAVTVSFALVRLVALVLTVYLLAVSAIGLLARATRMPALVRAADLTTVPAVRRLLGAVAGVSLSATAATLVVADVVPADRPATVDDGGRVDTRVVIERLPDGRETVLRRLPDDGSDDGTSTLRVDDGTEDEDDGPPGDRYAARWTIEPGDHLWHVAETTLTAGWGRTPTDAEIVPYWRTLIETNRGSLIDPANPDLVRPGQTFALPPVPTP